MIVDSHAHLDMPGFDADRDEVVRRALDAGVGRIVSIAAGNPARESVRRTLELAERYESVYAGIGVHPHEACSADDALWEWMEEQAAHPKVVLWGEIGLDYHYDFSPRKTQRRVFRRQLKIARRLGLPVAIHVREAWEDLDRILAEEWAGRESSAVLHSFTGTADQARRYAERGVMLSFSGMITFKKAGPLREAARAVPLDRILVETDSPYLAPVPHRGKRNEPSFVVATAEALAACRGIGLEEAARRTSGNARRLLGLGAEKGAPGP